jgi:quinol monooxygenase YgiN
MTTIIATLQVKPGQEKAFEEAVRPLVAHVKANEPGTRTYVFHRATSDPTRFAFYEVYADQAAVAAHSGSEPMQKFFGAVGGMLAGRPEIVLYEEIDGKHQAS